MNWLTLFLVIWALTASLFGFYCLDGWDKCVKGWRDTIKEWGDTITTLENTNRLLKEAGQEIHALEAEKRRFLGRWSND